jgi:quercetin 2,3-dioxygenase
VSNTETAPVEVACGERAPVADVVEVLAPREVPLGGPRAMRVRRTLPQRQRSLIGAWCFADHYGPDDVSASGGMDVAPHPHTGLQTVTWLFAGTIEHRDSLGTHAMVLPGELNLMTGGRGICHAEVSTSDTKSLHGVQLWVALPDADRNTVRDFQHYRPDVVALAGGSVRVFLGTLAGDTSPVRTFTPLLGAEITIDPRAGVTLEVDSSFEHGVLVDTGEVTVAGTAVRPAHLGYLGPGLGAIELRNAGAASARVLLIGGEPFASEILMWWNFVGRSHEEIVRFREAWQRESDQFGRVDGYTGTPARLPAPELPNVRIKPRGGRR